LISAEYSLFYSPILNSWLVRCFHFQNAAGMQNLLQLQLFGNINPIVGAVGMWESRRDFQEEWEASSLAFHAFHSSPFPPLNSLQGRHFEGNAAAKRFCGIVLNIGCRRHQ